MPSPTRPPPPHPPWQNEPSRIARPQAVMSQACCLHCSHTTKAMQQARGGRRLMPCSVFRRSPASKVPDGAELHPLLHHPNSTNSISAASFHIRCPEPPHDGTSSTAPPSRLQLAAPLVHHGLQDSRHNRPPLLPEALPGFWQSHSCRPCSSSRLHGGLGSNGVWRKHYIRERDGPKRWAQALREWEGISSKAKSVPQPTTEDRKPPNRRPTRTSTQHKRAEQTPSD